VFDFPWFNFLEREITLPASAGRAGQAFWDGRGGETFGGRFRWDQAVRLGVDWRHGLKKVQVMWKKWNKPLNRGREGDWAGIERKGMNPRAILGCRLQVH
jgi:hypothetical protein